MVVLSIKAHSLLAKRDYVLVNAVSLIVQILVREKSYICKYIISEDYVLVVYSSDSCHSVTLLYL